MQNYLEEIRNYCRSTGSTLSVAESVTAGRLQALLSAVPDAMDFFEGGITVYNCPQKSRHLGIDPELGRKTNGVDPRIAEAMAVSCCSLFNSRLSIAITGYAAPEPDKQVEQAFAYYAFAAGSDLLATGKLVAREVTFRFVQEEYARELLKKFAGVLKQQLEKQNPGRSG